MSLETRPRPSVDTWNKPFWAATAKHTLIRQRCKTTDGMRDELPYPAAMVKLDEDLALCTTLKGVTQADGKIGMRLSVTGPGGPDGFVLTQVAPAGAQS